ncbi:MAG: FG-GAP repeat domain-containing protein, partial [Chitinophagaceae bacterium]
MEIPLQAGRAGITVDSMILIWPDNTFERIPLKDTTLLSLWYRSGLAHFDYAQFRRSLQKSITVSWRDSAAASGLIFRHEENPFVEFDREPLIPHMVSREGPALAVGDFNGDNREDVFVGSAKTFQPALFVQQPSGTFKQVVQPALTADSMFEEVDACWVDVNQDRRLDLVVASGGNEYYGNDVHLSPRVFINTPGDKLELKADAFSGIYLTASCVLPFDFTGDGVADLFIGGRAVPWEYGEEPRSFLLANDGQGKFQDVTAQYGKEVAQAGFVTGGQWVDLDQDHDMDLVLSTEWGPITAYFNEGGVFRKKELSVENGWWQFVQALDLDQDGDMDLVAGNLGCNSRLQASFDQPVRLYYNDFDGNGKKEQVLTYYLQGKEIVFANKEELQKQLPGLKKKFLYAADFARAGLRDLLDPSLLKKAKVWKADYFKSVVMLNNGSGQFEVKPLPWSAQLSP